MRKRVPIGLALALGIVACGGTDASACDWRNGGCRAYGYYAPPVAYYQAPRAYYAPPPAYGYYAAPRAYYAPPPVYYAPQAYGYAAYGYYYWPRVYRPRFSPL
jgi:hypothetical protein